MARILLIDDDPDFSEALSPRLQQLGHAVQAVGLAEEGLRLLTVPDSFDLVLVDNKMPRMSGLEFLAALVERGLHVPVILMTSAHNDRTVIQAMNLGAFAYVIKPLASEEMMRELEPALGEALAVTRRARPVQ